MSPQRSVQTAARLRSTASVFAALGDPIRLRLVRRLGSDGPASIAHLTTGMGVTRQAVTKHLRVLSRVGLVRGVREGRASCWELKPDKLADARASLELISQQWDRTLDRLKAFVEE